METNKKYITLYKKFVEASKMSWWNPALNVLAGKLSKGVLNEMKKRIQSSNIKKEKLQLNEDTKRMRAFFQREIERHNKRKAKLNQKRQNIQNISKQLQNIQQQLQKTQTRLKQKEDELKHKETIFIKKERQYKKIIEHQMKILKSQIKQ